MRTEYLQTYLTGSDSIELLPAEIIPAKLDAVEAYTHRLIQEGGVSTDVFKKELGEAETTTFFDTVMFGTGNYRTKEDSEKTASLARGGLLVS